MNTGISNRPAALPHSTTMSRCAASLIGSSARLCLLNDRRRPVGPDADTHT